jgi:CheY-like chemotaxis protein
MSRLLLVDDNPSIHRIAESLLAPTDVELVCVASAAEALDRIGRGERFDVALVDTAMPGMDGWTLLSRLRAMEETARMPIALMAGVLDPVDPARLAKAPIQGFLKKPIELRELGDRVKALLATVVMVAPSPFSTVPATLAKDLMQRPEKSLPEYRPEPAVADAVEPLAFDDAFLRADEDLLVEEDLLVLDADDLWPEETPAPPAPVVEPDAVEPDAVEPAAVEPAAAEPATVEPAAVELPVEPAATLAAPDVQLELEELDFDSLQNLTDEPLPTFEPIPGQPAYLPPADLMTQGPMTGTLPEPFPDADLASKDMELEEVHLVTMSGLEELDAFPSDFQLPEPPVEVAVPAPTPTPTVSPMDDDRDLLIAASLAVVAGTGVVAHAWSEPTPSEPIPALPPALPQALPPGPPEEASVVPPAATGQAPAASGQAVPSEQAQALVQALLADPVLVDALVKAVVARMGDQVLREIAWEVMPDLAGRLQR